MSLDYYKRVGILPPALLNFLARMGWSLPNDEEKFSLDEMRDAFTFDRVSLSGPVFDIEKLDWLNGLYLRDCDDAQLAGLLRDWMLNTDVFAQLLPLFRERIERLDQFIPQTAYFFGDDFEFKDAQELLPKKLDKKTTYRVVKALAQEVDNLRKWDTESIEVCLKALAQNDDWGMRELFMTVRKICTGRTATPSVFETLEALGKARCQARIRAAMLILRP